MLSLPELPDKKKKTQRKVELHSTAAERSAEAERKSRGHTETEEANPVFGSQFTHRLMGLLHVFVSLVCGRMKVFVALN